MTHLLTALKKSRLQLNKWLEDAATPAASSFCWKCSCLLCLPGAPAGIINKPSNQNDWKNPLSCFTRRKHRCSTNLPLHFLLSCDIKIAAPVMYRSCLTVSLICLWRRSRILCFAKNLLMGLFCISRIGWYWATQLELNSSGIDVFSGAIPNYLEQFAPGGFDQCFLLSAR